MSVNENRASASTQIVPREWNGVSIQQRATDAYFDATAMCKACGRKFHDWQRQEEVKRYLNVLSVKAGIPDFELVVIRKGRFGGGTWIHPKVAMRLAQWLSPEFAVQVDEWVWEILTTGKAGPLTDHSQELAILREQIQQIAEHQQQMALFLGRTQPSARQIFSVIPLRDRVTQRWPDASEKQKRRCVQAIKHRLWVETGREPLIIGTAKKQSYGVDQMDLPILDRAIDKVMAEYNGELYAGGLFERKPWKKEPSRN